jgi:hypothetical protein
MYTCKSDCANIHKNIFVKEAIGAEVPKKKKSLRIPTEKLFETGKSYKGTSYHNKNKK